VFIFQNSKTEYVHELMISNIKENSTYINSV